MINIPGSGNHLVDSHNLFEKMFPKKYEPCPRCEDERRIPVTEQIMWLYIGERFNALEEFRKEANKRRSLEIDIFREYLLPMYRSWQKDGCVPCTECN